MFTVQEDGLDIGDIRNDLHRRLNWKTSDVNREWDAGDAIDFTDKNGIEKTLDVSTGDIYIAETLEEAGHIDVAKTLGFSVMVPLADENGVYHYIVR